MNIAVYIKSFRVCTFLIYTFCTSLSRKHFDTQVDCYIWSYIKLIILTQVKLKRYQWVSFPPPSLVTLVIRVYLWFIVEECSGQFNVFKILSSLKARIAEFIDLKVQLAMVTKELLMYVMRRLILFYTVITSVIFQMKFIKLIKCHMSLKMASTCRELSYTQMMESIITKLTSLWLYAYV